MKNKSDRRRCISCGQRFSHFMDTQLFCKDCKRQECFCGTFFLRFQVMQKVSGKKIPSCSICGERDLRLLVVNHMKGRKSENDTGRRLYDKILSGERKTDDLDLRCHNCNVLFEYMDRKTIFFDGKVFEKFLKKRGYLSKHERIFQHFYNRKKNDDKMNLEQVTNVLKDYGKKDKTKPLDNFFSNDSSENENK